MNVVGYGIWRDGGSLERQSVRYRTLVKSMLCPPQLGSFIPPQLRHNSYQTQHINEIVKEHNHQSGRSHYLIMNAI